jgi:NTP pyrophosphatase (non-canonical NTP hydrolase)
MKNTFANTKNTFGEALHRLNKQQMLEQGVAGVDLLSHVIHHDNLEAGWWTDLETGQPKKRNVGEMLMLVVSELAEAMEGYRKNLNDDKLPHRPMLEVELADAVIRILDMAEGLNLDLAGAIKEKIEFNRVREDHKIENRIKPNGKQF